MILALFVMDFGRILSNFTSMLVRFSGDVGSFSIVQGFMGSLVAESRFHVGRHGGGKAEGKWITLL